MKSYSPKEVMEILKNNGWKLERIKGDHYIFRKEDQKYLAVIPISKKTVSIGALKKLEKQTKIKF